MFNGHNSSGENINKFKIQNRAYTEFGTESEVHKATSRRCSAKRRLQTKLS